MVQRVDIVQQLALELGCPADERNARAKFLQQRIVCRPADVRRERELRMCTAAEFQSDDDLRVGLERLIRASGLDVGELSISRSRFIGRR
jgi:hypothetical protein